MEAKYLKYRSDLEIYLSQKPKETYLPISPSLAGSTTKIGGKHGTILPRGTIFTAGDPIGNLLASFLSTKQESFHECLFQMIDNKHLKDSEVYKRAGISRQLFSKIRCNEHYDPEKSTILSLAVGMKLNIDETNKLLACAGQMFSASDDRDRIVQFFIERGEYDMDIYNYYLDLYKQPLLGSS